MTIIQSIYYSGLWSYHISITAQRFGAITTNKSLNLPTILQKMVVRIIHSVGYFDHTHSLFLKSKPLKFIDIVELKTTQVMYETRINQLPLKLQQLFGDQGGTLRSIKG